MRMTNSLGSICRMRRNVSKPLMPPIRTSIITRSGLNLGIVLRPSSPLDAVASSISGESKIRWNEYCTSASSSISSSLLIFLFDKTLSLNQRPNSDSEFWADEYGRSLIVSLAGPRLWRSPAAACPRQMRREALTRGELSWLLRLGFATAAVRALLRGGFLERGKILDQIREFLRRHDLLKSLRHER